MVIIVRSHNYYHEGFNAFNTHEGFNTIVDFIQELSKKIRSKNKIKIRAVKLLWLLKKWLNIR